MQSPSNLPSFERFTNDDYEAICHRDFRSVRYSKEKVYSKGKSTDEEAYFGQGSKMKVKIALKDGKGTLENTL